MNAPEAMHSFELVAAGPFVCLGAGLGVWLLHTYGIPKMTMKTLLRIAALVSFLCCSGGGGIILSRTLGSPYKDAWMVSAVGLVFVGGGFFLGAILLVAAERFGRTDERK